MKAVIGFGNTNREIKMKIKSIFVAVLLAAGVVVAPASVAADKPLVESFKVSPETVDLASASTLATFELIVSHPNGIETSQTEVILKNSTNVLLSTTLRRIDSPLNLRLERVTFRGVISIPRDVSTGTYIFSSTPVKSNPVRENSYSTGTILGGVLRPLIGAESGLLIRNNGDLNLTTETFVGPSYDSTLGVSFNDPIKFNSSNSPIWRVGEIYDPRDYFEMRIPTLALVVGSATPKICSTDGKTLKFLSEGDCSFTVSTLKTSDYVANIKVLSGSIKSARIKPILVVPQILNQTGTDFPKTLEVSKVFGNGGFILPQSQTPTICIGGSFLVRLIAGGTCILTYQSIENSELLPSDVYIQKFEVIDTSKPIVVPTPVVTPTPVATPTAKPVVKKTITCVKGKKTVTRTGTNPKCPKGYKLKK
jgi:hypothetical protein